MKKILSAILAAVLCITAAACAPKEKEQDAFIAKILQINGDNVLVEPVEGEPERRSADQISINKENLAQIGELVGSVVEITYDGGIMETYPAKVNATKWKLIRDLRHMEYTEKWLDQENAEKQENNMFDHIVISQIYANCFFAETVIPMPWRIKLNGQLGEDWCVGDQVQCTYENTWWDSKNNRIEADMLTVKASDWQPDPYACYKPVIYLYPEQETEVSVKLDLDGLLTCTYPAYDEGWQVVAKPDGTLQDINGQTYNYLYWEGETNAHWDMTQGFCVKGEDTAQFLETALEKLGLNRREANEFIVYWLPLMEKNPYNIIAFQTDAYTDAAKLEVTPVPDTLIRVFMTWQPSQIPVDIPAQELTAPDRKGFTAVEWGGTALR